MVGKNFGIHSDGARLPENKFLTIKIGNIEFFTHVFKQNYPQDSCYQPHTNQVLLSSIRS